ncbi:hypothetical protein [Caudoviricetes sp.]|nr:hypothetical protein [Caudoviricetes sp.]
MSTSRNTLTATVSRYLFFSPPYEFRPREVWNAKLGRYTKRAAVTKTTVRAVAARIRQVADFFEANPKMRCKGDLMIGHKVCAMGAVENSRKIGLTWDPTASRNCNSRQTMNVMENMGIVDVNDSAVPNEQFISYVRFCADVLDAWANTGDWAGSVNKQPLAKRLKINV